MKEQTHWKNNFNYDYLGAYSFKEDEKIEFTIKSISQEKVIGSGGKKESCTVVHFSELFNKERKPMILNKTNCKTISKMYGTPYIEDWIGKKVTVFVEDNIKAFGDVVSALRISKDKPVLPDLDVEVTYNAVVKYLTEDKTANIKSIESRYNLSKEQVEKFEAILKLRKL